MKKPPFRNTQSGKKTTQQKALSANLVMVKREKTTEKQRKISRKAELVTLLENLAKVEQ